MSIILIIIIMIRVFINLCIVNFNYCLNKFTQLKVINWLTLCRRTSGRFCSVIKKCLRCRTLCTDVRREQIMWNFYSVLAKRLEKKRVQVCTHFEHETVEQSWNRIAWCFRSHIVYTRIDFIPRYLYIRVFHKILTNRHRIEVSVIILIRPQRCQRQ